jgi:hypothetical protein
MTTTDNSKRCTDCDRPVDYDTAVALADLLDGPLANAEGVDELAVHVSFSKGPAYFVQEGGGIERAVVCASCIAKALINNEGWVGE